MFNNPGGLEAVLQKILLRLIVITIVITDCMYRIWCVFQLTVQSKTAVECKYLRCDWIHKRNRETNPQTKLQPRRI